MRKLTKTIAKLFLLVVAAVVIYLAYLYAQEPIVISRLGGVLIGKKPGITERVVSGNGSVLNDNQEGPTIDTNALTQAIDYSDQNASHALLVFHEGKMQLEHYFSGYSENTLSSTASMHKTVLALLIGIAIDQGYIKSVDEKASTYINEWSEDNRNKITIKQMLQQSSGIGYPTFSPNPLAEWNQLVVGDHIEEVTLDQVPEEEPNSEFAYNGVNPQALGILLQRATGQRYSTYLSDNLWKPLAGDDAFVILDSDKNRMPRMFCCLDATARDWLRIGLLILNKGKIGNQRVVSEHWIDEMTAPSDLNPNYGYLTWLGGEHQENRMYNKKSSATAYHSEPFLDKDIIYLDGFGGQRAYIIPSKNLVIVRTGSIKMNWDDSRLPNLISKGIN
jgi:CubicO group peptidase (beta-lactamase class C family)